MLHTLENFSQRSPSQRSPIVRGSATPLVWTAGLLSAYGLIRKRPGLAASAALGAIGLLALRQESERAESWEATPCCAVASFAIDCSAERAYQLWRDFENLPRFMHHLQSVTVSPNGQSQWKAAGPLGSGLSWNAEIVDDIQNERISWRSTPGSQVRNSGSIVFRPRSNDRGIIATLRMEYYPPGGAVGRAFAAILGRHPEFTAREDLRRFKAFLESGEIPTTAGQSHGPRGVHGHLLRFLLREISNTAEPQSPELLRRIA